MHNYRVLNPNLTLKDNRIKDGSIIYIKSDAKNLIFKTTNGYTRNILFDPDCPLNMAIAIYCLEFQIINFVKKVNDKSLCFLFNAAVLRINDETPLKIFFRYSENPKILVNDVDNLIGG